MTKKIIISLSIIGLVAAIVVGGTIAYFSDTETSSGNTFTAGSIDLTVDNTCYYNGEEVGECTWGLSDLDGKVFFNFNDLKPGDWGEDTISLHVTSNDAWACSKIILSMNDDNGCTEPEEDDDTTCDAVSGDYFDGELAQNLEFIWWADDGDNVLEEGELVVIHDGYPNEAIINVPVEGLPLSEIMDTYVENEDWKRDLTTADKTFSMFNSAGNYLGAPLIAGEKYFIGKAWCFGVLTITPLAPGDHNPTTAGNLICNGASVTNDSQTDIVKGTLEFYVEQYRNNPDFSCPEHLPIQ